MKRYHFRIPSSYSITPHPPRIIPPIIFGTCINLGVDLLLGVGVIISGRGLVLWGSRTVEAVNRFQE